MSEAPTMVASLTLLLVAAPIGGFDVAYFHIWKFRLYRQPSARAEMITHVARGALFSIGVWLLATERVTGVWFWLLTGLFAADTINSIVDVAFEPSSRAPLGGVPAAEHAIHIVGATASGAATALFVAGGWAARNAPLTGHSAAAIPQWLALQGQATAIAAALLTSVELTLFLRFRKRARESGAT